MKPTPLDLWSVSFCGLLGAPNTKLDSETSERPRDIDLAETFIEFSDTHRLQCESSSRAAGNGADQAMFYEVEVELHTPLASRNQGRRQATGCDIERRVPGMVDPRRARQTFFE